MSFLISRIHFLISTEIYRKKNIPAIRYTNNDNVTIMFAKSRHTRHVNRQENPTPI